MAELGRLNSNAPITNAIFAKLSLSHPTIRLPPNTLHRTHATIEYKDIHWQAHETGSDTENIATLMSPRATVPIIHWTNFNEYVQGFLLDTSTNNLHGEQLEPQHPLQNKAPMRQSIEPCVICLTCFLPGTQCETSRYSALVPYPRIRDFMSKPNEAVRSRKHRSVCLPQHSCPTLEPKHIRGNANHGLRPTILQCVSDDGPSSTAASLRSA